jgi:hypothetical protein
MHHSISFFLIFDVLHISHLFVDLACFTTGRLDCGGAGETDLFVDFEIAFERFGFVFKISCEASCKSVCVFDGLRSPLSVVREHGLRLAVISVDAYVRRISHENDFSIFENPLLIRESVIKGPTTRLIIHETNDFLYNRIPPFVDFEHLRFWGLGNPGFFLGRKFMSRTKCDNVEDRTVRGNRVPQDKRRLCAGGTS